MTSPSDVLAFLAPPFVMSLVLVGIHCYLGLHVLARGVIFVDLSLAQVAALGATIAIMFGQEHGSASEYFVSLGATFAAAGLFSIARRYERIFSQEAMIGIVYAFSAAAIVLLVDRIAHGAEHIKDILVGQILWVTWKDVAKTSAIYAAVAAVHVVFRKQFIVASFGPERHGFWDFLFYALFGVVITSSVGVAGVLQVFTYLIVPALVSTLFFTNIAARLVFGWILGFALSLFSMFFSYKLDMPAGAFIVVCFTALPILALLVLPLFGTKRRAALRRK